jgi:hypothetical protein
MKRLLLASALVTLPLAAHATVIPTYCGPQTEGGSCEVGVLQKIFLNNAHDVTTTTGNVAVNNTGIPTVTITSDNNTSLNMFFDSAGGFATITPAHPATLFGGITLTIEPGYAFTELSFDVQLTPVGGSNVQEPFTIQGTLAGNGYIPIGTMSDVGDTDKEFSINLAGGVMNATNIFSTNGFDEIKHIEIGGVCKITGTDANGNPVCNPVVFDAPEPMTLSLFGVGLLGLGYIRFRRS